MQNRWYHYVSAQNYEKYSIFHKSRGGILFILIMKNNNVKVKRKINKYPYIELRKKVHFFIILRSIPCYHYVWQL